MRHGIKIPAAYKEEMLRLLADGPRDAPPPAWVDWEAGAVLPREDDDANNEESSEVSSSEDSDGDNLPFLVLPQNPDGRKCRCGSSTHLTVQSHACPLNPRNLNDGDGDSDADSDGDDSDGGSDGDHSDGGSDGDDSDGDSDVDDKTNAPSPPRTRKVVVVVFVVVVVVVDTKP